MMLKLRLFHKNYIWPIFFSFVIFIYLNSAEVLVQNLSRILTITPALLAALVGKTAAPGDVSTLIPDTPAYQEALHSVSQMNIGICSRQIAGIVSNSLRMNFAPRMVMPHEILSSSDFALRFNYSNLYQAYTDHSIGNLHFGIKLDTYSESELRDKLLLARIEQLNQEYFAKNPEKLAEVLQEKRMHQASIIAENYNCLKRYEATYESLVKAISLRDLDNFERAQAVFAARDLIKNIEDPSVKKIFEEKFEAILCDVAETDGSLDLTKRIQDSRKHLATCLKKLSEDKTILARLHKVGSHKSEFIFANFAQGIDEIAKKYSIMEGVCKCGNWSDGNKVSMSKFDQNEFTKQAEEVVDFIKQGNFERAWTKIQGIPSYANRKSVVEQIYRAAYNKVFNSYGILKKFENNSLWVNLPEEAKLKVKSNLQLVKLFNARLIEDEKLKVLAESKAKEAGVKSEAKEQNQSCIPEIKQENIPHAISQIKEQEQIPACVETGKEDLKTCWGASIKGAKSDIPVEVQEAKSDESSTKLKEVFGEPEIPAQKIEPESSAPECNSSKQRNVPDLVGEDVADKVAVEAEKESVEQKSETPEVDSEQEFKPAIKADGENPISLESFDPAFAKASADGLAFSPEQSRRVRTSARG